MKPRLLPASLALAALLSGCSSAPEAVPPVNTSTPSAYESDGIRVVLDMRRRGEIGDAQAMRLVAAMRGVNLDAAPSASAPESATSNATPIPTPVVTVPVPVATAPAARERPSGAGYKPGAEVAGRMRSVGSDSMDRIMEEWTKAFSGYHPRLRFTHEGKGSSTALPALLEGRADIGPMSRPLKADEIAKFREKFGYAPTSLRVAVDALAVYVHPSNPILKTGLTLRQLDAAFSSTRKRGGAAVVTWGDLGLTGDWKDAPVRVYSRNTASGTHGFFREEVLSKGEFREGATYLPGSAELVAAVGADRYAIGYSGIGYRTDAVGAVPVAVSEKTAFVAPTEAAALSRSYPVSRDLYLVLNRKPGEPASPSVREFSRFVLSAEGQACVHREGYFPVPVAELPAELAKVAE